MRISSPKLLVTIAAVALLGASLGTFWATRDAVNQLSAIRQSRRPHGKARTLVDLGPWQRAQELAGMAVSSEEVEYGREAERLADHEVDQAFAAALREATLRPRPLNDKAKVLAAKVSQLQQVVKDDQARIDALTRAAGNESGKQASNTAAATDLDVAKAQLGLDNDELADAQQDLARASGDNRTTIQQELAEHQAEMRKYDAEFRSKTEPASISTRRRGTLAGQIDGWLAQNARYALIQDALRESQADVASFTAEHNRLQNEQQELARAAASDVNDRLARLRNRSAQSQLIAIYDDRIQTSAQLATVYGRWGDQVQLQHLVVLHLIMRSVAIIAFIVLCVIGLNTIVMRLVEHRRLDRRRKQTLASIVKLGVQFAAVLIVLFVIFGLPSQTPTIVGLTTAGLTVVLQDFIIAFFGWFILIGKKGIGVGDWVEINGVGGEVVEVGLFRTALLETGNWTDAGHPTGRRVTFINSFAIKGQFFNFSTSGQWMWDEIMFTIPVDTDSYAAVERIRNAVLEETKPDMESAEKEWQTVTRQNKIGVSGFNAEPSLNLRPSSFGIDVVVRYVTRALHRYQTKNRIYDRVLAELGKSSARLGQNALPGPRS